MNSELGGQEWVWRRIRKDATVTALRSLQSGQVMVARVRGACVRETDTQSWTQQREMALQCEALRESFRDGGRLERA